MCRGRTKHLKATWRFTAKAVVFLIFAKCACGAAFASDDSWEAQCTAAMKLAQKGDVLQAEKKLQILVKERPLSFRAHIELATVLQRGGQPAAAANEMRTAVRLRPDAPLAWYQLGQILSGQKWYTAAIYDFRRALSLNPTARLEYHIYLALGIAYSMNGDLHKGSVVLARLVSSCPQSAEAHFELATIYAHETNYHSAVKEYRETVRLNPLDENAKLALAKALDATDQFSMALPFVQEYIRSYPGDPAGYHALGKAWLGLAKFDKAGEVFARAVQLDSRNFHARYNLGFVLARLGKVSEAVDQMEAAEKLKPQDAQVHYQLYRLWLMKHRRRRADEELRELRALNDESERRAAASVMEIKGNQLLMAGDAEGAARALQKALTLFPNNPEFNYNLALALSKLGKRCQELHELKKVLMLDPMFVAAHNQLGMFFMAEGKSSEAEKEFRAAIAINPQFAKAQNNLGVLLGREKKYNDATVCFRTATESDPELAEAYLNWGLVMAQEGEYLEAKAKFQEALQIKPHFVDAEKALKMVLGSPKNRD